MTLESLAYEGHQSRGPVAIELGQDLAAHPRLPVAAQMRRHAVAGFRVVGKRGEERADPIRHAHEIRGIHAA